MGCLGRVGCLTLGVLVGATLLTVLLATRPVGPRYEDGVYRYEAGGRQREVPISREAARSFDAKAAGNLPQSALLEAVTLGVPISEEELNSRVAEELAGRPLTAGGAEVERVFIRLSSTGPKAYVYSTVQGVAVTLSSDLVFRFDRGRAEVKLRDPHAGKLPIGFALPTALSLLDDLAGVEERIALVIPPQVRAIRYEEGRMRIVVNPTASSWGARSATQPICRPTCGW